MVVELLLLVLIAGGVFAFVLAPLILPERTHKGVDQPEPTMAGQNDPVTAEKQPVHESS
jgi:hypothetical protein